MVEICIKRDFIIPLKNLYRNVKSGALTHIPSDCHYLDEINYLLKKKRSNTSCLEKNAGFFKLLM